MRRALLSVSDKTGLVGFARGLVDRGFELVSTGGTAARTGRGRTAGDRRLRRDRLPRDDGRPDQNPTPEGPRRHPGAAPRPTTWPPPPAQGIGLFDLVVVNLYPFARTAADPAAPFDELDRADRHRRSEPGARRRQELPRRLRRGRARGLSGGAGGARRAGGPMPAFRFELARRAFAHTAAYDTTIAEVLDTITYADARHRPRVAAPLAPARLVVEAREAARPALRREPPPAGGVVRARPGPRTGRRQRACRARSCPTPTCSTWMPRRASCSSSTNRRRRSSSTPLRAAWPPASRCGRGVRHRPRRRRAVSVRRHRRPEPAAGRGDGTGASRRPSSRPSSRRQWTKTRSRFSAPNPTSACW